MLNKKLILQLSLFGLAMAFATISMIPGNFEMVIWFAIFVYCAYRIAKEAPGKYFLHGFLVSLLNCVWVTAAHILFFKTYISYHLEEATMIAKLHMSDSPRLMMLLIGPFFGIFFGLILGLFSVVAGKMVKKNE